MPSFYSLILWSYISIYLRLLLLKLSKVSVHLKQNRSGAIKQGLKNLQFRPYFFFVSDRK